MLFSLLRRAIRPARTAVSISANTLEALESRTLLSTATPTNEEQFMLELINRARFAPLAEANRYRMGLNDGLAPHTITTDKRQPLAFNPTLISSARQHSQWMISAKVFSHTGAGGSSPAGRMAAAGYSFPPAASSWAENLGWAGRRLQTPNTADMVAEVERRLFIDAGIAGRGHRLNMLNPNLKEIGVGVATGPFAGFNSAMTTADMAYSGSTTFLTGVAYKDTIKRNNFYNVGEGLGNITITATRSGDGKAFSTTTWSSGGYTLALTPGTYTLSATGGLFSSAKSITIKDKNIKADFLPATTVDKAAPTATLLSTRRLTSSRTRTIIITYKDDTLIDASTIDTGDVQILGPNNFSRSAKLISLTSKADSPTITATYKITGPRTGWAKGRYTVKLNPKAVRDTAKHFTKAKALGSFAVKPA